MDIRCLRHFAAIAQAGGFSAATEVACVSQPALSQSIRVLEQELGCRLFQRGRAISLTVEGERLLEHCRELFHLVDDIREDLGRLHDGTHGTVRAALLESPLIYVFPEIIARFAAEYPRVNFQFSKADSSAIEKSVLAGEVHFGLISRPPQSDQLDARRLVSFPHILVAAARSRGSTGQLLARLPLFLLAERQREALVRTTDFFKRYRETRVTMPINCVAVVRQFVVRGLGLGLLPGYVLGRDLRRLETVDELQMPLVLIRKRGRRVLPAAERFMDHVAEWFAEPNRGGASGHR